MNWNLKRALICIALLTGCGNLCGETEPALTLAGSSDDGTRFELFDDGAERALIQGTQMGMHVWLQLRLEGFCAESVSVDRRVLDASDTLLAIQRGPLRFTEGISPETFELDAPLAMQLCPTGRTIIDTPLRFAVRAEDGQGNVDITEKPFVPVCASGACDICDPP